MDDRGRTPRSRRDRAAIEEKMARDRSRFVSHRSASDRRSPSSMIDSRSRPNRGAIVAKIVAHVKRNWSWNQADSSRIWSHDPCPRNRLHDAWKPLPRTRQLATIFGPISSLKTHVFLLLFFNFWSIREGIKRISRKIFSSSWSPHV